MRTKATILITAFIMICTVATPNAAANTHIDIDSAGVQMILATGVDLATRTNNQILPFLPNEATGAVITFVFGLLFRFFEKRKMEKRIREEKKNLIQ